MDIRQKTKDTIQAGQGKKDTGQNVETKDSTQSIEERGQDSEDSSQKIEFKRQETIYRRQDKEDTSQKIGDIGQKGDTWQETQDKQSIEDRGYESQNRRQWIGVRVGQRVRGYKRRQKVGYRGYETVYDEYSYSRISV